MNVLIVYAGRYGQTAKIAHRIARVLETRGAATTVVRAGELPASPDLERFDVVIVGSSVRFGRHAREVRDFVCRHRERLDEVESAFFSVSGAAIGGTPEAEREAQRYVDDFVEETGWRPGRIARFGGAVPYTRYDPITRFVLKRIQRKAGRSTDTSRDHEYTDWGAVERFAARLVPIAGLMLA